MGRRYAPVVKPCRYCGTMTEFENNMQRTCKPCQKINLKAAVKQANERRRNGERRAREEYRPTRSLTHPTPLRKRPKKKADPALEIDMARGELTAFCRVLGVGPSGPVRHIQPGSAEFAQLARMYGGAR